MSAVLIRKPALRDPAWAGRVFWLLAAGVVLWPMLVLAEFKPWVLLAPDSLQPTLRFLAGFVPPRTDPEFLALVARATWRTVAIATAGLTLALLLALPLTLLSVRVRVFVMLSSPAVWAHSARPKSRIFSRPSLVNRKFDGFRSRWTIPAVCAACRPSASCVPSRSRSDGGSAPPEILLSMATPEMNSITRKSKPSWFPNS